MILPGKEQTAEVYISNMKRVVNKLAMYGVKVKVFRQDSLVAAKTEEIEDAADELTIEQQIRAPYQHEGQDENFIRTFVCSIASMFAAAPWMPRQLWLYAAQISILIYNLMLEPSGSKMTRSLSIKTRKLKGNGPSTFTVVSLLT